MAKDWRKFTPEQMADALRQTKGLVTLAAEVLGTDYKTVKRYLAQYAVCRQAQESARARMGDLAEGRLFQAIDRGDIQSVHWYLKTQCKDRGYGDQVDVHVWLEREARRIAEAEGLNYEDALREIEAIHAAGRRQVR